MVLQHSDAFEAAVMEHQLWLWLDACEEGKPRPGTVPELREARTRVVPFLQCEAREGREAREAGVVDESFSSKTR